MNPNLPFDDTIGVISVQQLKEKIDQGTSFCLIDVRQDWEWDGGHLPGALHIPLGDLASRCEQLPEDVPLIIYCHHGGRSLRACELLNDFGFAMVKNLEGGIDAWSRLIDPQMKRY